MNEPRLIETDAFSFEFLSQLAERESWRKEIHRPIYHVHKWWAKRLGSVFRGILLGCALPEGSDLRAAFHRRHDFAELTVFDPFLGSGTTIGEAHKLGCVALGRDINPVAVRAARTALGPMDRRKLEEAFGHLSSGVGERIRGLYRSRDSLGRVCDVLYHFWVMQASCPRCQGIVDLFPSWVIARNAYPDRKPEVRVLCPSCGAIHAGVHARRESECPSCGHRFDPEQGNANRAIASCDHCDHHFKIQTAIQEHGGRPDFRLYGKLVLTKDGVKEYLSASPSDLDAYHGCGPALAEAVERGTIRLPSLALANGYNTRQAMGYGFHSWRDFFNDRQLLALGWLQAAIQELDDEGTRECLLTLFSGVLEFNNLFASYKGEGTGAVRHMFSHHVLKPERTPIEANVWGTPKSSGSFSNLFRSRLLRALEYREAPTELSGNGVRTVQASPPFSGEVADWPSGAPLAPRGIHLSQGDSSTTGLPDGGIDLVVTDPPFFDNVHYSELADFFHAWRQLTPIAGHGDASSTRSALEVQDSDGARFAEKLRRVFVECHRILRDDGLLVFTYHHARDEGWSSVARAILGAGFVVVNAHPVKSEMSVATPKSQAKDPIQIDIIVVCRKSARVGARPVATLGDAVAASRDKLDRLIGIGLELSRNDRRVVLAGQLLTTLRRVDEADGIGGLVNAKLDALVPPRAEANANANLLRSPRQLRLF